jgi:hypothetical protein
MSLDMIARRRMFIGATIGAGMRVIMVQPRD